VKESKIKDTNRKSARLIGMLFIAATVFSILSLVLYVPILNNPGYLIKGPTSTNSIIFEAIFEMLAAAAVVGTSIAFFPILRKHNETVALGYVGGRILEAVLIVISLISILTLLTLLQSSSGRVSFDNSFIQVMDELLRGVHSRAFILGPNFLLGINTMLYSSLLYKTKLVPGKLAGFGLFGAVLVFALALLELFGIVEQVSLWGGLLAAPVGLYEMTLAIWLIAKGFNLSAGQPEYLLVPGRIAIESAGYAYTLHTLPWVFGAVLYYFMLHKSRLVPRFFTLWGLITILPFLIGAPLAILGNEVPIYFYLPYVPFELVIGVWLMFKGFDSFAILSVSNKTDN
jgi:hypothetical protein